MNFLWVLFVIYIAITFLLSKFDVVPQLILIITCFAYLFGFYVYDSGEIYWLYYYILAIIFVVFSLYIYRKKKTHYKSVYFKIGSFKFNKFLYYTIVFFIAYHYIVGGIPIFQQNVMLSRFNMTSSGLFGIPGRMAQYGPAFLFFYTSYFFNYRNENCEYRKYTKYFYISIMLLLTCALFAGTKASILGLLYYFVYYFSFCNKEISIKRFFKIKYIVPIVILLIGGFAYFYYYFIKYQNQFSQMAFLEYFYYRLTSMSAEAGAIVLGSNDPKISFFTEIVYYLQKYFHLHLTSETIYPLEIAASLKMNGVSFTNAYAYYTPVTIGGFTELIYHFGYFSIIVTCLIAYIYGKILHFIKIEKRPFKYASYCLLIYVNNSFFAKGGLVYTLINFSLVYLMFYLLYIFGNSLRYTLKNKRSIPVK